MASGSVAGSQNTLYAVSVAEPGPPVFEKSIGVDGATSSTEVPSGLTGRRASG